MKDSFVTIFFFVLTLAGCGLLYMSHRHQGWLARPLATRPWRRAGLVLLLLALADGLLCFSTLTAVCAWLTTLMVGFGVLPFFSLLITKVRREPQA